MQVSIAVDVPDLGARIRAARQAKALDLKDLAQPLGISTEALRKVETAETKTISLQRLALIDGLLDSTFQAEVLKQIALV